MESPEETENETDSQASGMDSDREIEWMSLEELALETGSPEEETENETGSQESEMDSDREIEWMSLEELALETGSPDEETENETDSQASGMDSDREIEWMSLEELALETGSPEVETENETESPEEIEDETESPEEVEDWTDSPEEVESETESPEEIESETESPEEIEDETESPEELEDETESPEEVEDWTDSPEEVESETESPEEIESETESPEKFERKTKCQASGIETDRETERDTESQVSGTESDLETEWEGDEKIEKEKKDQASGSDEPLPHKVLDWKNGTKRFMKKYARTIAEVLVHPAYFPKAMETLMELFNVELNYDLPTLETVAKRLVDQSIVNSNFSYTGARLANGLCLQGVHVGKITLSMLLETEYRRQELICMNNMERKNYGTYERCQGTAMALAEMYVQIGFGCSYITDMDLNSTYGEGVLNVLRKLIKDEKRAVFENVKCVVQVLKLAGWELANSNHPRIHQSLECLLEELERIRTSPRTKPRTKAVLDRLLDIKENNWNRLIPLPAPPAPVEASTENLGASDEDLSKPVEDLSELVDDLEA